MSYCPAPEPDLFRKLEGALQEDAPVAFLLGAGALLAAGEEPPFPHLVDTDADRPPSTAALVDMFLSKPHHATDALLVAWAEILGDPELQRVVAEEVWPRIQVLPAWLAEISRMTPKRALSISSVFREDQWIALEVGGPRGGFTLMAIFDTLGYPSIEDAYLSTGTVADLLTELGEVDTEDIEISDISLVDVKPLLEDGLDTDARMFPPLDLDTWTQTKWLFHWQVRKLPDGGQPFELYEVPEEELDRLTEEFLASPEAALIPKRGVNVVDVLFSLAANYGPGDPRRIGPVLAERLLLDLVPRKVLFARANLQAVPTTLAAITRFGHRQLGIAQHHTDTVLQVIKESTREYRSLISRHDYDFSDEDAAGPDLYPFDIGEIAAGDFEDGARSATTAGVDGAGLDATGLDQMMTRFLLEEVGGQGSLDDLDSDPLPSGETLSLRGVPQDIHPLVQAVGKLLAESASHFFPDPEMRTAALRTLTYLAASNPDSFRRRANETITAGAVAWITACNNKWFDRDDPEKTQQRFLTAFNLKGSPRSRAASMLTPLGVEILVDHGQADLSLSQADLLTSENRRLLLTLLASLRRSR